MYKQTETQIPVLCHDGGRHYKSHFKLEVFFCNLCLNNLGSIVCEKR